MPGDNEDGGDDDDLTSKHTKENPPKEIHLENKVTKEKEEVKTKSNNQEECYENMNLLSNHYIGDTA